MPKLSSAWYVIRTLKQIILQETLLMIYYAYFHLLMTYNIKLWGNFPYSNHIFRLQKKITTTITYLIKRINAEICTKI
jgi:hypothetical protein